MFPKIVHYCWFGATMPKQQEDFVNGWKDIFPNHEIRHWNEDNIPRGNSYVETMLSTKNWAFLADYVRLYALYNHGGIYLDTDIQVLKNFEAELDEKVSCLFGFESPETHDKCYVGTAVIASQVKAPFIKEFLSHYDLKLAKRIQRNDYLTGPQLLTKLLKEKGLTKAVSQEINGIKLLSREYMYPDMKDFFKNDNCYTIHHEAGSWVSDSQSFSLKNKFFKKKRQLLELIKTKL